MRKEIWGRIGGKNESGCSIENSLRKKSEREMLALREQNAHLSCTLASVQERLSKANNKIHRQQLEITSLRCNPCASVNTTSSNKTCERCACFCAAYHMIYFIHGLCTVMRVSYVGMCLC